jgi:ketosteroid isomerase-like protein
MADNATHEPCAVPDWVREMYRQVDAKRVDRYIHLFAPDAELRFGAGPVVRGADAIRATLEAADAGHQMRHTFLNCWERADATIVEFEVDYRYDDGRAVTFPAMTVLERAGGAITSMRVYPAIPAA